MPRTDYRQSSHDPELSRRAFYAALALFLFFVILTVAGIFLQFQWYVIVITAMTATFCVTMMAMTKTVI